MKKLTKIQSTIEAVLFLENSFISKSELARKASCTKEAVAKAIERINVLYKETNQFFSVIVDGSNYLLAIKKEMSLELAHLYRVKNQQRLSKALVETLAVIAYSQPITKPEIDQLRGVNSDGAIKVLLSQDLIKTLGKKVMPGSPNQYGTSSNFLKTFGLKSIKDLPKMKEQDIKKFEMQNRVQDDAEAQEK